jgi:glyoxylate reductase
MARVVVSRALAGDPASTLRAAGHEVALHDSGEPLTPAELRALAAGAEGLLCVLEDRIDAALLDAVPSLRAIAVYAVGTDNVDHAAAAERGVAVGNTPDVLTDATADLAMALLLAAARRLPEADATVRGGQWTTWEPTGLLGLELRGARLAIVGSGRIGRATGDRARAFGMNVDLLGRDAKLHEAIGQADVVSLHTPLTDQTRGLVDEQFLAAMKPGSILVNTSRGPLVDQVALAAALASGHLAAAAIDVTTPEPLPADDPLLQAPNLIVLPHIGSATHTARRRMAELSVANLLAGLAGEPMPHPVVPAP